jgi:Delta14-sterol reductase
MGKPKTAPQPTTNKHVEYEFGGPIGAFMTVVSLPFVILGLYFLCNGDCLQLYPLNIPALPDWSTVEWWNNEAFIVTILWFAWLIVLSFVVPAPSAQGVKLPNGTHLSYKLNGFRSFIVTLATIAALEYLGHIRLSFVFDHFVAFISSAVLISFTLSFYLYFTSFIGQRILAAGGDTGNPFYDFFIGRELNPRIGSFDLKVFCELRPGLIGWVVIDLAMAMHQYETYGAVSNGMILVCLFQSWYVADALWFERAILTTMDVTTDGFGYMLAFGDLAWVPFTYSIQARYLASVNFFNWDPLVVVAIVVLKIVGYSTFRGSNSQKDQFRRNPNDPSVKGKYFIIELLQQPII